MKFFLDSADISQLKYVRENWGFDGVTTNPKYIMAAGQPLYNIMNEIAGIVKDDPSFPAFFQINPYIEKRDDMILAARKIAAISPNFVVKLPASEQGASAAYLLEKEGIKTCLTLVFSPGQALQAGRIGCKYVAPYIAWKEECGENVFDSIKEMVQIYKNYGFKTEIIAASIRHPRHIIQAALAGVDAVTAGFEVYKKLFDHPFLDRGLTEVFQKAWDKTDTTER